LLPEVVENPRYQVGTSPWWGAIVRRYRARPGPGPLAGVAFSGLVVPVFDIDRLVDRSRIVGIALTAVDGANTIATVPAGKRWKLSSYRIAANATANYNRQMHIFDQAGSLAMTFEAAAAGTTSTYRNMGCDVWMDSGWFLSVVTETFVAAGAAHGVYAQVLEQDMADDRTPLLPA